MKPIKPSEVAAAKGRAFPAAVFDAFNELITERFSGVSAVVKQVDVLDLILQKMPDTTRAQLFERGWLNVEEAYEAEGWKVEYDKPGFNETYPATFTFTAPERRNGAPR